MHLNLVSLRNHENGYVLIQEGKCPLCIVCTKAETGLYTKGWKRLMSQREREREKEKERMMTADKRA